NVVMQTAKTVGGRCLIIGSALWTALLLQPAYSDHQIGAFEHLHQLVEDALVVVRARLEVFLEDRLRLADGLKGQLLIGHRPRSNKLTPAKKKGRSSQLSGSAFQILFRHGTSAALNLGYVPDLFLYLPTSY